MFATFIRNEFVKHYAGVIEDGSLVCQAKNHGLKHVKQVTFTKGRDAIGEPSPHTKAILDLRAAQPLIITVRGCGVYRMQKVWLTEQPLDDRKSGAHGADNVCAMRAGASL